MSRKNKNYRAWLHNTGGGTTQEAWDAAWKSHANLAYSLKIRSLQLQLSKLQSKVDKQNSEIRGLKLDLCNALDIDTVDCISSVDPVYPAVRGDE